LQELTWIADDGWSGTQIRGTALDPVFRALAACPNIRMVCITTQCASADAIRNLLHSPTVTNLHLKLSMENWLAVANEIQHGRNNVGLLALSMLESTSSEATKAVKAIASAIRWDHNLVGLTLKMENGFTDEAGVALAEALTDNKTLFTVVLTDNARLSDHTRNKAHLGAQAYEAFSAMLRVNTNLNLRLPPLDPAGAKQRVRKSRSQMFVEQLLNKAGRGELLSSSQTTRAAWVDALQKLNSMNGDSSPRFQVSCLYSLLRMNPAACILHPSGPSNVGV
jgi:hypothetical protein